ncbi:MAG: class I SAM-dependent methyltransferase [Kofleriaceae bacterium]|nr:class I SAM-dependent methyltransferase [Kofleriaceae bacterium]
MSSARISPTAHYTGAVWLRHGLSDPAFATREGRRLHRLLVPLNTGARVLGGPSIDGMLLARHRLIDHLLMTAIERGEIGQVIEVAAGLSPRGWRMSRRFRHVRYLEADLPAMAARKRALLGRAEAPGPRHRVVEIDAMADAGPRSIDALTADLDPSVGTAIITEGLVNYFPGDATIRMWRRFAAALRRFPRGLYLSDLTVAADARGLPTRLFRAALGAFVRGGVYLDFADAAAARRELGVAGFAAGALHRPADFTAAIGAVEAAGASRVQIIEATVG